ncbi:MAG: hypothetical protein AB7V04_05460 [Desulfomonilaceae bacterium]
MSLKPLDIVVSLKLLTIGVKRWSYRDMASSLGISSSSLHESIKRSVESKLLDPKTLKPRKRALHEWLVHGVKFFLPPIRGPVTRGIPTSYAAPPLENKIVQPRDFPPVWPDEEGNVRGVSFLPIHECVPKAAKKDAKLYELLALLDAVRGGRVRERIFASEEITKRLGLRDSQKKMINSKST